MDWTGTRLLRIRGGRGAVWCVDRELVRSSALAKMVSGE
jgi:hypothetical protein